MVYPGAKNPVAGSSTSFDLEIRELHVTAVPWVLLEVFLGGKNEIHKTNNYLNFLDHDLMDH